MPTTLVPDAAPQYRRRTHHARRLLDPIPTGSRTLRRRCHRPEEPRSRSTGRFTRRWPGPLRGAPAHRLRDGGDAWRRCRATCRQLRRQLLPGESGRERPDRLARQRTTRRSSARRRIHRRLGDDGRHDRDARQERAALPASEAWSSSGADDARASSRHAHRPKPQAHRRTSAAKATSGTPTPGGRGQDRAASVSRPASATWMPDAHRAAAGLPDGRRGGEEPSMGKSSFALDVARHASAMQGKNVAVFSLRGDDQAGIDGSHHRRLPRRRGVEAQEGATAAAEFERMGTLFDELKKHPLYIDDDPDTTIANLRHKARRQQMERGLDLLVIDYLPAHRGDRPGVGREPCAAGRRIPAASRTWHANSAAPIIAGAIASYRARGTAESADPRAVGPPRLRLDRTGRRHRADALPPVDVQRGLRRAERDRRVCPQEPPRSHRAGGTDLRSGANELPRPAPRHTRGR